ncbi:HypC/HybG/HupF family hydrogenase formation chaperone [Albimonas sp. CAU 1670]|uniref:HypC/HybG/HupF family hydrogenase formation chaperone n=1 Tax=Albimonas sp. CAU 1670 TaxID=3032599 RepID=UPI0023DB4B94|nr:HypC/HybG/HupF family hydrogenase formation chaperone [Albimonas sp. CAU 1670]MDF2235642.1 HypC/HybG/HupF family hydrogenase formation chaperone [Albimonas sp. CAU 1670]
MCVGVPFRILSRDGLVARAVDADGREETIDLSLTGPIEPGAWCLTFLGAAREAISPEQAARTSAALAALRSAMLGGGLGDAFEDLEASGPALPPHLAAALAAGRDVA